MDNRSIFRKFIDWFLSGGVMKTIGRGFLLVGIVAALVIAGMGFADMYTKAVEAREVAQEKAYTKAQKNEFNKRERANKTATRNGEELPYPDLPATMEEYTPEVVEKVKLDLEAQLGGFITGYLGWALLPLVAGIFLNWILGNIIPWFQAMKAAGPVRVTAGAIFWISVVIAAVFLVVGLWEILNIRKSTLPEVGKILMEKYLIWSALALGCGYGIQQVILKFGKTHEAVFASEKFNAATKWLYLIVLFAWPFVVAGCVILAILKGWVPGVIALAVYGVLLVAAWLVSGVCPFVRTKEEIAADAERRARTSWVCESCGMENPRSAALCDQCGAVKPTHHML